MYTSYVCKGKFFNTNVTMKKRDVCAILKVSDESRHKNPMYGM